MRRLHYVPRGHGSHVSDHLDPNGTNVRQRRRRDRQAYKAVITVDAVATFLTVENLPRQ